MKPTLIIDSHIPFIEGVLDPYATVQYREPNQIDAQVVQYADALLVRTRTRCDKALLEGSSVSFIGTATIGMDHIDAAYCQSKGIVVANAPGCNAGAVVQYVFTALDALAVRKGLSFAGKTLGIVGVGHVGKRVAALGQALGFRVLLNDPPRALAEGPDGFTSLDNLLQEADVVTLHVPLAPDTMHLANTSFFQRMKPTACFINASRGPVVDETALALARNRLGSIVLDVWEHEPEINPDTVALTDLATPHIAGYSLEGKRNATVTIVRALARHFNWESLANFAISLPEPPKTNPRLLFSQYFPIFVEDDTLRGNPSGFEQQRSHYVYRREWTPKQYKLLPLCFSLKKT